MSMTIGMRHPRSPQTTRLEDRVSWANQAVCDAPRRPREWRGNTPVDTLYTDGDHSHLPGAEQKSSYQ